MSDPSARGRTLRSVAFVIVFAMLGVAFVWAISATAMGTFFGAAAPR